MAPELPERLPGLSPFCWLRLAVQLVLPAVRCPGEAEAVFRMTKIISQYEI